MLHIYQRHLVNPEPSLVSEPSPPPGTTPEGRTKTTRLVPIGNRKGQRDIATVSRQPTVATLYAKITPTLLQGMWRRSRAARHYAGTFPYSTLVAKPLNGHDPGLSPRQPMAIKNKHISNAMLSPVLAAYVSRHGA